MFKTNKISYFMCYSVHEVALLVGRSEHTVHKFIKNGLKTIDNKQPFLIRGLDLKEFLKAHNDKNRRPTDFAEMYCLKCRECRVPLHKEIWFLKSSNSIPHAASKCPVCRSTMCKPYKIDDYPRLKQTFHFVEKPCISDSTQSHLDDHFDTRTNLTENNTIKKVQECMKF